jgi:hypothetical protein
MDDKETRIKKASNDAIEQTRKEAERIKKEIERKR